jgi:hypothetical protein
VAVSLELLQSEVDGGRGLRLVLHAAMGPGGELLEGAAALAPRQRARRSTRGTMLFVHPGADRRALRAALPAGVHVWTRPQLVQAIVQQSFNQLRAYLET